MNAGLYKDYIKTTRINPAAEYFRATNEKCYEIHLALTTSLCRLTNVGSNCEHRHNGYGRL
jgi:hypothetical protein